MLNNIMLKSFLILLGMFACLSSQAAQKSMTLASTTSTQASGFFDYYLPLFTDASGIEVKVVAVGTGQALKMAENGDADALLVHDKPGELKFIKEGYGLNRKQVMYNDFVIIGPTHDPANIRGLSDAVSAFSKIAATKAGFISRGDDSGTNRMELRLWQTAKIQPATPWYKEAGAGMGAVLNMLAATGNSYTISDRATWISFKNKQGLSLLVAGDSRLFNQYSAILVNPQRHPHVKKQAAMQFIDWITSAIGQQKIKEFKINGQRLYTPNALQE